MGDFAQLPLNGGVDFRVIMPVKIGPNGRVGVDVLPSAHVPKQRALPALDDQRFALEPVAHLREGMPQMPLVKFSEWMLFHTAVRPISSNGDKSSSKPVPNGWSLTLRK